MKLAGKAMMLVILAAVLAGCVAAVDNRAGRREQRAEQAYPPTGQLLDVNGVQVHAHIEGSGPDLVLIHGASGSTRDFTFSLVSQLRSDFRVIAFDRPGLGWSEHLPGYGRATRNTGESPMEQAVLLQSAAAQLGAERPIVLGHSYGGAVALAWALERPDDISALVLLGAVSNPWPGDLDALYGINASALGAVTVVPLISAFAGNKRVNDAVQSIFEPDPPPKGYLEYVGAGLTLRRETLRANARQVNSLRPHIVEMEPGYTGLGIPVEIVHGTEDVIVPAQVHAMVLAEQIKDANLTLLEGTGHMPHHTNEAEVIDIIRTAAIRAALR